MLDLNKKQLDCVMANAPLVVVAAPGSGKTATIVERIKFNVEQRLIEPRRILALSFTVNAANELKERSGYPVESRTIHSWCFRNLMRSGLKAKVSSEYVLMNMAAAVSRPMSNEIARAVNFLRLGILRLYNIDQGELKDMIVKVKKQYEYYLRRNNLIDFNDMLIMMRDKLNERGYRDYIQSFYDEVIIDEAQDMDKIQLDIVKKISCEFRNCVMVGDKDQSIYGFMGSLADIENIASDNAIDLIRLDQTYRFGNKLSRIAESIIRQAGRKTSIAENNIKTEISLVYGRNEAMREASKLIEEKKFKPEEVAILSRTNVEAESVQNSINQDIFNLTADKIRPHVTYLMNIADFCCRQDYDSLRELIKGVKGIGDKTADKMLSKLNSDDMKSIMNKGIVKTLGIKRKSALDEFNRMDREIMSMKAGTFIPGYNMFLKTPERFYNLIDVLEGKSVEDARDLLFNSKLFGITSMTVHASKGLEFPLVVVNNAGGDLSMPISDYSEEIRLSYVAVTRAKDFAVINTDSMFMGHLQESDYLVQV